MKFHKTIEQGSWDWMEARSGKVTGSEIGNLISDKGKLREWKSATPNTYLARKLAEKWRGGPVESFFGSRQTDQGTLIEPMARKYFAALMDIQIDQVGGIESDDGRLWCSPDGLIGETEGLEIKCPNPDTHIGWLLEGHQVPEEHVLQVQFALFMTGWAQWRFLSYVKDMPPLIVAVTPEPNIIQTITWAVEEFQARFDAAWAVLLDMNGGPPPTRPKFVPTPGPIEPFTYDTTTDNAN
jgi:hypothetical protein